MLSVAIAPMVKRFTMPAPPADGRTTYDRVHNPSALDAKNNGPASGSMTGFASVPGMSRHAAPARTAFVTLRCCAAVRCGRSGGCCAVTGPLPVSPIALACVVVEDGSAEATERSRCAAPTGREVGANRCPLAGHLMRARGWEVTSSPRTRPPDRSRMMVCCGPMLGSIASCTAWMLATTGVSSYRSDLLTACGAPVDGRTLRGPFQAHEASVARRVVRPDPLAAMDRSPVLAEPRRATIRLLGLSARDFRLAPESD